MRKFFLFLLQVGVNMDLITDKPINLSKILSEAHNPKTGAIVLFSGEARNHHQGRNVDFLEYEAHNSMAEVILQDICQKAKEKWDLQFCRCIHRVGRVNPGESSVVIVTGSAHRKAAYEANEYIIDQIKEKAPIWKKEFFVDGSEKWG